MVAVFDCLGWVVLPFVAMISALVLIHELGHYAGARLVGLPVSRVSVGFGPALLLRCSPTGTEWRLSLLPLGGYVHVAFDQRRWARAVVIAGGPLANLVLAAALLLAHQMAVGVREAPPVVAGVQPGSPAEQAGIRAGDHVLEINSRPLRGLYPVLTYAALHLDAPIILAVERDGRRRTLTLAPVVRDITLPGGRTERVGLTGLLPGPETVRRPALAEAAAGSLTEAGQMLRDTLLGLSQVISGARPSTSLVGVIGLADMTGDIVERSGFVALLGFAALVSLNLAVVNALPLPVLDGGQLLLLGLEGLLHRPLPGRLVGMANAVGLVLLSGVLLLTTWNDVAVLL